MRSRVAGTLQDPGQKSSRINRARSDIISRPAPIPKGLGAYGGRLSLQQSRYDTIAAQCMYDLKRRAITLSAWNAAGKQGLATLWVWGQHLVNLQCIRWVTESLRPAESKLPF
jgi:hypothetical protein